MVVVIGTRRIGFLIGLMFGLCGRWVLGLLLVLVLLVVLGRILRLVILLFLISSLI
jgi:hypothetical protein